MSLTRIYQATTLEPNSTLMLDEAASHHLARVLRSEVGESLILFNGNGSEYTATIKHILKKTVQVDIHAAIARDVESPIDIYLAQGIARGEKMDFIIQKSVELGVKKIFPLITERCNVRLNQEREEKRLRHWQSVVISACEQSGRNRIPEVHPAQSLESLLSKTPANLKFVLSPHVNERLPTEALAAGTSILLLIGPEGGLSEREVQLAKQSAYQPLQLGPRILRTETASLAALTLLQCHFGDF